MASDPEIFEEGVGLSQAEFELRIRRQPLETVTAYRPDGTQAFAPRMGGRDAVPLPARTEVDLAGTVLVHNHPDVRTFSASDLQTAALRKAKGLVAVLPSVALRLFVPYPSDWPIEELLDRNDLARRATLGAFGYLDDESEVARFHLAFARLQCVVFSEVGVIMEIDGHE